MTTEVHEGDEDHLVPIVPICLISLFFLRMNSRFSLGLFIALAFLGCLFWAHSHDPFHRTEFKVQISSPFAKATADKKFKVSGITVLPRGFQKGPVVIYAHGSGGTWMTDGNDLRQFAELGMAAVGFDYDQTNSSAFEAEFAAVLDHVRRQSWGDTNSIAWVGFSLGSQNTLRYLLKHPETQPQVYVRLAGGWIPELDEFKVQTSKFKVPILLIHGENDNIFPVEDARRLSGFMRTNGIDVTLHVVPGHGHGMVSDQAVVFRLIAEYCKAKLTRQHPMPEFPKLHPYPFWLCISPAFVWLGFCFFCRRRKVPTQEPAIPWTKLKVGLRVVAIVLVTLAVADTALHLVPPRMQVSPRTLELARKYLLAPKWHQDFETLAAMPIWQGQRLQTLLTHVELAHYTVYELINWKVEDALYRDYVLSLVITGGEHELNWRRELWENFYPRIRHENTTSDAAAIIVRFLRQRVTIAPGYPQQPGIESMWNRHIVNPDDFEILYTATLRSVGVPARLSASRRAEFWTGQSWQPAPPPLATTWVD
jgi:pimeloyl-ACP methyl ester carboxylesterase